MTPRLLTSAPTARAVVAAVAVLVLAGCSSGSPDGSSAPSAPATPELASTPLDVPCATLVAADDVLPLWPGLEPAPDAGDGADARPDVALVGDLDGTVCRYVADGGVEITVAVAELDGASLDRVANRLVTTSTAVPTYGVEGYFDRAEGPGTAEAVAQPWWVVATSGSFVEPGDAEPVVAAALATLTADRP
ncbi:hypothetical protein [Frigoribacterium salinisoli]